MPATPASRLAGYLRGGGVIVPLLTTLLAFLVGGLVMLVTGKRPDRHLRGDLEGHGPPVDLPVDDGR